MTRDDVHDMIRSALKKASNRELPFNEETDLLADNVIDSLDAVRFVFELEAAAKVKLPDGDLAEQGLYKVGRLVDFIQEKHRV